MLRSVQVSEAAPDVPSEAETVRAINRAIVALWRIDDDEPDVDQWRDALDLVRESLDLERASLQNTTREDIEEEELLCLEVEAALDDLVEELEEGGGRKLWPDVPV
jgi:sucrose-6-phosphate hydrolase SacC (GH32 family)